MLQYIAQEGDKYSIAEQTQMAIEGGCKWVVLRLPGLKDEEIRELCRELIPLCKESATILTIENHVELAKEIGLHGVYLREQSMSAMAVRELFGPDGIIGVEVRMASSAMALKGADIDYVVFPPDVSLERIGENIEALRNAAFGLPIVAEGDFTVADIPAVMAQGVSGVAIGREIGDAHDPVAKTEQLITALNNWTAK